MSDDIKKPLEAAFAAVLDGLKSGAGFAKEQIPLLLKEKLTYDFYSTASNLLFTLLIMLLLVLVLKHTWAYYTRTEHDRHEVDFSQVLNVLTAVATGVWGLITIVTLFSNVATLVKIQFAPRLYLMEWLMALVKAGK